MGCRPSNRRMSTSQFIDGGQILCAPDCSFDTSSCNGLGCVDGAECDAGRVRPGRNAECSLSNVSLEVMFARALGELRVGPVRSVYRHDLLGRRHLRLLRDLWSTRHRLQVDRIGAGWRYHSAMPRDVERLLRSLTPALALLGACEPAPGGDTAAPARATAKPVAEEKPAAEKKPVAEEKAAVEKKPVAEEKAVAEEKPMVEEKPVVEKKPVVKPPPFERAVPQREPRPTCPTTTTCIDQARAKASAPKGATISLGCPTDTSAVPSSFGASFNETETKSARASGSADTCCYSFTEPCPGGRSLLDEARRPVTARMAAGDSWSVETTPLEGPAQARALAAQAWLEDAATEHASVASFGRVALELMSLAGPPELIAGAHQAALDELEHTRICLGLARASGAEPVEPGALPAVPQREADLARFAADTFIEGCVGETVAALMVTRAARVAAPSIRSQLERIADDETQHAALAWRMIAWAVKRGGAPVLDAVEAAARDARRDVPSSLPAKDGQPALRRLGRLDAHGLAVACRDAWRDLIDPMLASLAQRGRKPASAVSTSTTT